MSANNNQFNKEDDDKPLDPAVERVRRKVMRLMGISIAIMMVGLMAVIGAIFYKISGAGDKKMTVASDNNQAATISAGRSRASARLGGLDLSGNIKLPSGGSIISSQLSDGQILLNIRSKDGKNFLWVYDLAANRVFAKIVIEN